MWYQPGHYLSNETANGRFRTHPAEDKGEELRRSSDDPEERLPSQAVASDLSLKIIRPAAGREMGRTFRVAAKGLTTEDICPAARRGAEGKGK